MLAHDEALASRCGSESDEEEFVARSVRMFRVKLVRAPSAFRQESSVVRLCRDLEDELKLIQTPIHDFHEIDGYLKDVQKMIQDLLLSPAFDKLPDSVSIQNSQV